MKQSPAWTPALLHGAPVKAYRKQPTTFAVVNAKKKKQFLK